MGTATLTYTGELVITTCWCGIVMALPSDLYDYAHRSGATCYCPLGHGWVRKDNIAKRLKETEAEVNRLRALWSDEYDQHKRTERRLKATRGVVTRTKRRIAKGLCPRCHAHFGNLEKHIASQHPEFIAETAPLV